MEPAAVGGVDQAGRFPGWDILEPAHVLRLRVRDGVEERYCIRMERALHYILHICFLHQLGGIHDEGTMREIAHGGEVVGDVDNAEIVRLLNAAHELQNLHAHGGVEHGDRLVSYDQHRAQE